MPSKRAKAARSDRHKQDGQTQEGERPQTPNSPALSTRTPVTSPPRASPHASPEGVTTALQALSFEEGRPQGSPSAQSDKSKKTSSKLPGMDGAAGDLSQKPVNDREVELKMLDFGQTSWNALRGSDFAVPKRQGLSKDGKEINVGLNIFPIVKFPSGDVHQYDITVSTGNDNKEVQEKRGLVKRAWCSDEVQSFLGNDWIFDGNQLAWSMKKISEKKIDINMDKVNKRAPRKDSDKKDKKDMVYLLIRFTKTINFTPVESWLQRKADFTTMCTESLTFLDHLIRETPSKELTRIKRSFFGKRSINDGRYDLTGGIEVIRGVFAAIRPVMGLSSNYLALNVDVANATFWKDLDLIDAAMQLSDVRDKAKLEHECRDQQKGGGRSYRQSTAHATIDRRLRRIRIFTIHGQTEERTRKRPYIIQGLVRKVQTNGPSQMSAAEVSINVNEKDMTIKEYFQKRYDLRLRYYNLPLVLTTKNAMLPMEVCRIVPMQRYAFELGPEQTAKMIKQVVQPPRERWHAISQGVSSLKWDKDPFHKSYGLQISNSHTVVKARLLPPPRLFFQPPIDPGYGGRWDLRGKKFAGQNLVCLDSWGVAIHSDTRFRVDPNTVRHFMQEFVKIFIGHGGAVRERTPYIVDCGSAHGGQIVERLWNETGNHFKKRPQILFFIVPWKAADYYHRVKRSCECRFGVVSQVLNLMNVQKCAGQYISNVCLKVNAKLRGYTTIVGPSPTQGSLPPNTMIIGADVSHTFPGSKNQSKAAMTVSADKFAARYTAAVQNNGFQCEFIEKKNIDALLIPAVKHWNANLNNNRNPTTVFYLRDGVSAGQIKHVLADELGAMKEMFKTVDPKNIPKITVIICSKRHHVRFFPEGNGAGDRNGNALPGTLVETGCTHPTECDFYLCAHAAIKGTARPVHYQVVYDENNFPLTRLQKMIYEQCYQYVRSTTPVSYHPAIYYAHLASNRAQAHTPPDKESQDGSSDKTNETLLPFPQEGGIGGDMWFV